MNKPKTQPDWQPNGFHGNLGRINSKQLREMEFSNNKPNLLKYVYFNY